MSGLGSVVTEHAAVAGQVRDEEVHAHRGSGCPSPRAQNRMIVVEAKTAAHGDPPSVWAPGDAQEPSAACDSSRPPMPQKMECPGGAKSQSLNTACKGAVIAMLKSWPMKLTSRRIMCARGETLGHDAVQVDRTESDSGRGARSRAAPAAGLRSMPRTTTATRQFVVLLVDPSEITKVWAPVRNMSTLSRMAGPRPSSWQSGRTGSARGMMAWKGTQRASTMRVGRERLLMG